MSATGAGRTRPLSIEDHVALARWAAHCAAHVLRHFEAAFPADARPRAAIASCRAWATTGVFRMADVRSISLAAHAAARTAKPGSAAQYAARAAGQAAATPHVPTHALGAAWYAAKAADVVGASTECAWQYARLPARLRPYVRAVAAAKPALERLLRYPGMASAPGGARGQALAARSRSARGRNRVARSRSARR